MYSEISRDRDGKGSVMNILKLLCLTNVCRFVEFETAGDLKVAVDKLDNQEFKGANVRCIADVCSSIDHTDFH